MIYVFLIFARGKRAPGKINLASCLFLLCLASECKWVIAFAHPSPQKRETHPLEKDNVVWPHSFDNDKGLPKRPHQEAQWEAPVEETMGSRPHMLQVTAPSLRLWVKTLWYITIFFDGYQLHPVTSLWFFFENFWDVH